MSRLILTVGSSSCGKSSWADAYIAENPNTVQMSRDDYRFNDPLKRVSRSHLGIQLFEQQVTMHMVNDFVKYLYAGRDVIIADTNLNGLTRNDWLQRAKMYGLKVEFVVFYSAYKQLLDDPIYARHVPDHVLGVQYRRFNEFLAEPAIPSVTYTFI